MSHLGVEESQVRNQEHSEGSDIDNQRSIKKKKTSLNVI
jgi:hypothetical protein